MEKMKLFKKAEGGREDSDEGVQHQARGEWDHDQSLSESAEPGWWGGKGGGDLADAGGGQENTRCLAW